MNTNTPLIRLAISFLILVLSICGCSGSSIENEVVGKWMSVDEKSVTEFFDDGTLAASSDEKQVAGKWEVLEERKIKINISMSRADLVFTGVITNDELRITFGDKEDILVKEGSSAYEKILAELNAEKKKSNEIIANIKRTFKDSLWQCGGDTWYGSAKLWASDYLVELRDPDVKVKQSKLTEANKANGIEWRGVVQPISKLFRKKIKNAWSEWYDGTDGVVLFQSSLGRMGSSSFYVESINGQTKWKPELPSEKWACAPEAPGASQGMIKKELPPKIELDPKVGTQTVSRGSQLEKTALNAIEGTWQGTVKYGGGSFSVNLVLTSDDFSVNYPTYGCGGNLEFIGIEQNIAMFKEKLSHGIGKCADNGRVLLAKKPDGQLLYQYMYDGKKEVAATGSLVRQLTPVTQPSSISAKSGKEVYDSTCMACHTTGAAGAPKMGDKSAWTPRLEKGMDALLLSAVNGMAAMPPRGLCMKCTDEELSAAIEYMTSNVTNDR